jgi:hypothetical protein
MKASELRIGNWVYGEGGWKPSGPQRVESISSKGINAWSDMGASGYIENVEPIPLDATILEKAGFRRLQSGLHFNGSFYWDGQRLTIGYDSDFQLLPFEAPCQFLHQLQNLYFALTGQELDISL